jgi:hypothetical protein
MTATELKTGLERSTTEAEALSQLWSCLIGTPLVIRHFHTWLYRYGYEATKAAVERTATKFSQLNGAMDEEYLLRYCGTCAKNAQSRAVTQCSTK